MTNGSRVELITNYSGGGAQRFNVEAPIILEDLAYVLLADDTKLMAP